MIIRNKHVAIVDKKYTLDIIWHTKAELEEMKAAMDATPFARSKESLRVANGFVKLILSIKI